MSDKKFKWEKCKMIRDRSELEQGLTEVIGSLKKKRKDVQDIETKLYERYKFTPGTYTEVTTGTKPLSEFSDAELCLIAEVVCEVSGVIRIAPLNYFHEDEIKEAKIIALEPKEKHELLPITIENVLKASDDEYITVIEIAKLVEWYHANLIVYDYETQRSPDYKRIKSEIIPTPHINPEHVDEICELFLKGEYLIDTMSINVYSTEVIPVTYKSRNLTIHQGITMSILDGFHRLRAAAKALSINPKLDQNIQLSIKVFSKEKAERFFGQINTYEPVSRERKESLKKKKLSDFVVKNLIDTTELKSRVSNEKGVSVLANQLTTFSILSEAIDKEFKLENQKDILEVSDYLSKFFAYLLGSFPDQFTTNYRQHRETSYISNPNMFAGYITLARRFRDEDIPINSVEDILKSIDFSKDGTFKNMFDMNHYTEMKKVKNKVQKFFHEIELKLPTNN